MSATTAVTELLGHLVRGILRDPVKAEARQIIHEQYDDAYGRRPERTEELSAIAPSVRNRPQKRSRPRREQATTTT